LTFGLLSFPLTEICFKVDFSSTDKVNFFSRKLTRFYGVTRLLTVDFSLDDLELTLVWHKVEAQPPPARTALGARRR
jgi:hypothetical protein